MLYPQIQTRGLKQVNRELSAAIKRAGVATSEGLLAGARLVLRESDRTVPIDQGNLAASGEARFFPLNRRIAQVVYHAAYAVYVHENIDANFKRPGARARFLQLSLRENQQKVINEVRKRMRKRL